MNRGWARFWNEHLISGCLVVMLLVLWTDAANGRKQAELELSNQQPELITLRAENLEQRTTIDVLRRRLGDAELATSHTEAEK